MISRYPRPGFRIAPYSLREILEIPVSHREARKLGRGQVTLAELDERTWTRFDDKACRELGGIVIRTTASRIHALPESILVRRVPAPRGAAFDDLQLEARTRNCLRKLKRSGAIKNPEDLRNLSIKDLLGIRALGAKSLVDLLTALETANAQNEPAATVRAISKGGLHTSLTDAATELQDLPQSAVIRIDDPRLGKYLRSLVRATVRISAGRFANPRPSLSEIASRIVERRTDPVDIGALTDEIRALIKIIASLSEMTLEMELRDLGSAVATPRVSQIALSYFGWDGQGTRTLQAVCDQFDLTRERVRQIGDQFIEYFSKKKPFSPALHKALNLVHSQLPRPAAQIERALVTHGISKAPFRLKGLITAARILDHHSSFRIDTPHGERFVLQQHTRSWAPEIGRAAASTVRHWGAATVKDIVELVNEAHGLALTPEYVSRILQTRKDFSWLDSGSEHQWFWLSSVPRNRLINRVAKVLAVSPSIPASALLAAVSRTRGLDPPKPVLLEFCRQLPICRVKGQTISARRRVDPQQQLSETEFLMLKVLNEHGPLLTWGKLEKLCNAAGINSDAFTMLMASSPIICRYARAVYGLVGAKISQRLIASYNSKRAA